MGISGFHRDYPEKKMEHVSRKFDGFFSSDKAKNTNPLGLVQIFLPFRKLTFSHPQMDGWNTCSFPFGWLSAGAFAVSFGEQFPKLSFYAVILGKGTVKFPDPSGMSCCSLASMDFISTPIKVGWIRPPNWLQTNLLTSY